MDDKALEARGVNALGARRKMLKVFDQVKGEFPDKIRCLQACANFLIEAKADGKLG